MMSLQSKQDTIEKKLSRTKDLVEGVLVIQLVSHFSIERKDTHIRRQTVGQVCIGRALYWSGARDDHVNGLCNQPCACAGAPHNFAVRERT